MTDSDHSEDYEPIPETPKFWRRLTMGAILIGLIAFASIQLLTPMSPQLPTPSQKGSTLDPAKYKEFLKHYELGQAAFAQENYAGAAAEFGAAVQIDPEWKLPYEARVSCSYRLRDWNSVVQDETKIIALDPNDAEAYHIRAEAYKQLGKPDLAAADEAQAQKLQSGK